MERNSAKSPEDPRAEKPPSQVKPRRRSWLRDLRVLAVVLIGFSSAVAGLRMFQRTAVPTTVVTLSRYYRVSAGYEKEFERLFLKNTYAVLEAQKNERAITGVTVHTPKGDSNSPAPWTLMVSIQYPARLNAPPQPSEELLKRLFANRETYDLETIVERKLVEAQWEVVSEQLR